MKQIKKIIAMLIAAVMCMGLVSIPAFADTDTKTVEPADPSGGSIWYVNGTKVTTNVTMRVKNPQKGFVIIDASDLTVADGTVDEYIQNAPAVILSAKQSSATGLFASKVYGMVEDKNDYTATADYSEVNANAGSLIGDIIDTGKVEVSIDVTDYVKSQEDKKYVFKFAGYTPEGGEALDVRFNTFTLTFDYSDGAKAKSAVDAIEPISSVAVENFTLPTEGKFDTSIVWTSSDAAIAVDGENATVTRPTEAEGDKQVTLTASITIGEATETKDFVVTVPAIITSDVVRSTASADTFVQSGSNYANTNYNYQNWLYINGTGRQNFIRFNVMDVSADEIGEATLNLYLDKVDSPVEDSEDFAIQLYGLSGQDKTSWEEDTLTYNIGAELGLLDSSLEAYGSGEHITHKNIRNDEAGSWIAVDITNYIKSQDDGVYAIRIYGSAVRAYFHTREDEELKPYLEIQRGDAGAVAVDTRELTVPNEASGEFTLPVLGENGSEIAWSTESELVAIDGENAVAAEVEEETKVILTATVTKGEYERTKEFEITLIPAARDNLAADKAALTIPMQVSESFTLPILGENGSEIAWESDSELIAIDGENAEVTEVEEETIITLTATLTNGQYTDTKTFEITILPVDTEADVNADVNAIAIPQSVSNNFTLPLVGAHGTEISWESDNEAIVIDGETATVTRPEGDNVTVTLTATVTKGESVATKEFTVEVLSTGVDTSKADADTDAAAITVPERTSADFILPVLGAHGSAIAWESDNEAIAIDGENASVTLSAEEKTVTLTATVTKGEYTTTRTFTVKIVPVGNEDTAADMAAISILGQAYGNFTLPVLGERGSQIVWKSESPLVTIDGANAVAESVTSNTNVVLTATVINGQYSESKKFTITILPSMITFTTSGKEISDFKGGQHIVAGTIAGTNFTEGEKLYIATYSQNAMLHVWALDIATRVDIDVDDALYGIGVFVWKNGMEPVAGGYIQRTAE